MDDLTRTERRRVLAAGALLTLLALDIIWGSLAWRLLAGAQIPMQRWQASPAQRTLLDALSVSFLVLSVASAAAWMTWQYAAHESLWLRSVPGLTRKPSVVAWWLVPIIGLFTAGFALGEILRVTPRPRWLRDGVARALYATWWFFFFVAAMSPGTTWDTDRFPFDIKLSASVAITYAIAGVFAFPLVWLLDRGVGRVLPWDEAAPDRTEAPAA